MKKQISPKIISLTFSILVICFAIGFYVYAVWTEPGAPPPGGNVDAPLNVGSEEQIKQGNLVVNALGVSATGNALLVPNGNVGIGTTDPGGYKLWVEGNLRVTGGIDFGPASMKYDPVADKLTVDTEIETATLTATTVCLTGDSCRTTWPSGGVSLWSQSGSDIYYNLGNVGIGTTNPSQKLDVSGNVSISGNLTVSGQNVCLQNGTNCPPGDGGVSSVDLDALCGTDGKILKRIGGVWQCADDMGDTTYGKGSVGGGGIWASSGGCIQLWGNAFCTGGWVTCPSGYTIQQTGYHNPYISDIPAQRYYICIKD